MSECEPTCAHFVQRVDEFTQPLAVEVLAEADRLTWRLWEPLETLRQDYPVGKVTQKQYRVHPSGVSIPKAHSLLRRGQPSPYILPVRLDMPPGHTETIEGVQWGLVDEIALDPQAMRAKPRMYGEHLSDWAAWMFVLCTDTWRFMTPFNRHLLTRSSRIDSEGFTALSLPLTKARQTHLVAGSCLVPWHKSPLSAQMVLRINAHPGGPLWTNLQVDVTQPLFWLALWWALALVLLGLTDRWRRAALRMLWAGLVVLGLLGFRAIPDALLRPLENRYPVPTAQEVSRHVGMIVLGGATQHPGVFLAHGQVPLAEAAERMSAPVDLMRQHPKLELVFSGGEGRLLVTGTTEAELARAFYEEQGVNMTRVTLEDGSRNTRENARQVAKLQGPRCQQPWLLVTSAWHMPRSMAEFEAVGCKVTAYPVDFRTGDSTSLTEYSMAQSLLYWQTALHEWLGLLVYGVTR